MPDPQESLELLIAGNQRFVAGTSTAGPAVDELKQLAAGQSPFAILIGCSDSRVPAEIVFDQGIGDLFVIRIAGNIVARSQIGSVEFAATMFGSRLVLVLGHTGCGAVKASIEALRGETADISPGLRAIVDRVVPALHEVEGAATDVAKGVEANVRRSVRELTDGSEILRDLVARGQITIAGAIYDLTSGEVSVLQET